jgi:hypothetical protein
MENARIVVDRHNREVLLCMVRPVSLNTPFIQHDELLIFKYIRQWQDHQYEGNHEIF